jgi:hypothetical protein
MRTLLIRSLFLASLPLGAALLQPRELPAAPLPVRHSEGTLHGFVLLSSLDGKSLAPGELIQIAHGNRVMSRLTFHFKDGSLDEETAVFSQDASFRLISDHHVQKGPVFPHPMDVSIDVARGQVTTRYIDGGKEKVETDHLDLPPDLSNGIISILMQNIPLGTSGTRLSFVASTPKPRLVKLAVQSQGEDAFSIGDAPRRATHYIVKVELGGVAGVISPLVGKQPPDTHVWILGGLVPTFLKSEGPFYEGGPVWRVELASPVWQSLSHSGH